MTALFSPRPPLVRRRSQRMVAGVAGGIADHLGVRAEWVRLGFVVLGLLGLLGVGLYVAGVLLLPAEPGGRPPAARLAARDAADLLAYGLIGLGVVLLSGLADGIDGRVLLGLAGLVALGLVLASTWPRNADDSAGVRRSAALRTLIGGGLAVAGVVVLLTSGGSWGAVRTSAIAIMILLVGVTLVVGPWLLRVSLQLVAERNERVRSQARADMAAHLHDSVLQTLAMIQRRAGEPQEVVRLARTQERELRTWLATGRGAGTPPATFSEALSDLVAELEREHGVPVELVPVRDCPFDDALEPLRLATREAIVNAQRHSGAPMVSVYCEVSSQEVTVFVRDRGSGFDRQRVPLNRHGVRESIEGRLARSGGRAEVRSTPGEGTEVELAMPRSS